MVRELSPRIWMAIRAYASDDEEADDLLQDCWLQILERLDRYERHDSFVRWAMKVSRNCCRTRLREGRQASLAEVTVGHVGQLPEDAPSLAEGPWPEEVPRTLYWKHIVHEALGQLSDRERDVIVLRLLEGRDTAETALAVGVSESGVRSILLRAMTRLRRMKGLREALPEWIAGD